MQQEKETGSNNNASNRASGNPAIYFRDLLTDGLLDEAYRWQQEHRLATDEIVPYVLAAFNLHKGKENYRTALNIGRQFQLDPVIYSPLYAAELSRLLRNREYEDAARWAREQGFSNAEIKRAAKLAYEQYINSGNVENAIRILTVYNLKREELLGLTIAAFNEAYKTREYFKAAVLGKAFDFSLRRTLVAAIRAAVGRLKEEDSENALEIIIRFSLISDDAFYAVPQSEAAGFVKALHKYFFEPAFERGNFTLVRDFTKSTELFDIPFQHELLKKLLADFFSIAAEKHNNALRTGDIKSAKFLRESFNLFSPAIANNHFITVLAEVLQCHKNLLKSGDLNGAVALKNDYRLFSTHSLPGSLDETVHEAALFVIAAVEKGDLESSKLAIKEYNIPAHLIDNALFTAVFNLLNKYEYKKAFKILDDFRLNISDQRIKARIKTTYNELIRKKEYIVAAQLAKKLNLGRQLVENGAFRGWRALFVAKKYDEALRIKNSFRLPKKYTNNLAKDAYWHFMENRDYSMAVYIRRSYRISLTLTQRIMEFIKMLFFK